MHKDHMNVKEATHPLLSLQKNMPAWLNLGVLLLELYIEDKTVGLSWATHCGRANLENLKVALIFCLKLFFTV